MKIVRVIPTPEVEKVLDELRASKSKHEKTLLNGINKKIELVKGDIQYGDPIVKKLIPNEYRINYDANNLFRIELPGFWRMLYTLKNGLTEDEIVVLIVDIINHKIYNKRFGYKG